MSYTVISKQKPDALAHAWAELIQSQPSIRIREAAQQLNCSEAELLATKVGEDVIRLKPDWKALIEGLPALGRIMSLTRNDACVLEHKGPFEEVKVFGKAGAHHMGLALGPIETRIFLNAWHVAFACEHEKGDRKLTSIQVFDKEGQAITKIYLQDESNYHAFEELVEALRSDDQSQEQRLDNFEAATYNPTPNAEAFLADWAALKDTHDFFPLLRKHKIHRFHAIELALGSFARRISVGSIEQMLHTAADRKLPIMVFAGNRGNLQIHQDVVRTIRMLERGEQKWLNVLDPDFNMHLRIDLITDAFVVTKPTADGPVTSLECYDANRELIVQFFGLRKPGIPELTEWQELVGELS